MPASAVITPPLLHHALGHDLAGPQQFEDRNLWPMVQSAA
jgi:hypothetical protein